MYVPLHPENDVGFTVICEYNQATFSTASPPTATQDFFESNGYLDRRPFCGLHDETSSHRGD